MAFAVVAIHFRPNYNHDWQYPELFGWFIRLGVPFFFICSGYLVGQRLRKLSSLSLRKEYLNRRIKKLAKLWIYWVLISLPLALYSYGFFTGNGLDNLTGNIKSYVWSLADKGWSPRAAPLWFIYSMIWITAILRLTMRIKRIKYWLLTIFIIISIVYWCATFYEVSSLKTFYNLTGNILGGGIYILLGMILVGKENFIKIRNAIGLLLTSLLLYHFDLPLAAPVGGVGLFIFSLRLPLKESGKILSLRTQSMWIYFTHEYILFLFFIVFSIKQTSLNPYILMLMVMITVALLAVVLNRLQAKPQFKFLNSLVS